MDERDLANQRLERLRHFRVAPPQGKPMQFVLDYFKREVEKPYKRMGQAAAAWLALVPPQLCPHTRLESLKAGVLRVGVSSSARLFELDRLLREGLESRIISACGKPGIRKIQLRVSDPSIWEQLPAPDPRPASNDDSTE